MTPIEEAMFNAKIKSSEDSLNYPLKLDAKYIALASTVESADAAPTEQSYELLETPDPQLESQLSAWHDIVKKDVAALEELTRKKNIPVIFVAPEKVAGDSGK